jgi:hypothetical protein
MKKLILVAALLLTGCNFPVVTTNCEPSESASYMVKRIADLEAENAALMSEVIRAHATIADMQEKK